MAAFPIRGRGDITLAQMAKARNRKMLRRSVAKRNAVKQCLRLSAVRRRSRRYPQIDRHSVNRHGQMQFGILPL